MFWIARAGGQKVTIRSVERRRQDLVPPLRTFFCPAFFFTRPALLAGRPESDEIGGGNKGTIMKAYAIPFGAALLLLAGCNRVSEEQAVENTVGASLASQGVGTVQQVDLTKGADNNYSGTATVRRPDGQTIRLNCTARHAATAGNFDIACGQVLDQVLIDEIKTSLRATLTGQGLTVSMIDISRQDDDHVTGAATVRDASGNEVRLACGGARQPSGRFNAQCAEAAGAPPAPPPAEGGAAPAPAEEGAAPAEEGAPPPADGDK
jgi:hypothetical protein